METLTIENQTTHTIHADVVVGCDIKSVCVEAIALSQKYDKVVSFDFNDVRLCANPQSASVTSMCKLYSDTMRVNRENYIKREEYKAQQESSRRKAEYEQEMLSIDSNPVYVECALKDCDDNTTTVIYLPSDRLIRDPEMLQVTVKDWLKSVKSGVHHWELTCYELGLWTSSEL